MNKITTANETVLATLREVVAESPDYVYSNPVPSDERPDPDMSCMYVHGDVPGCLIGHVLHRLGVPLGELAKREGGAAYIVADDFLRGVSGGVLSRLDFAQGAQDSGKTWRDALIAAGVAL